MTNTLVTSTGVTIEIGRELGKGGEGAVYEVPVNHDWVAKLYNAHHQPDALKQAKLRFMASTADAELLSYAAWPQETLHKSTSGPVVGFLMPKISGRAPIHMLYSPVQRRQDFPQAAWDFLLFAARNTAAAFAAIHHHGHVLGDVNQCNVLVGTDSKVVLIDTDSFQINADDTMHLCKVGVAHFTPPELQGVASFDRVPRTSNHDNFGLALLIFHLLLGGRHPYSGVPLQNGVGEALEKDIRAFRYAYAPDGYLRGISPPPNSIRIAIVPKPIQAMFTKAFTENGPNGKRPTAEQWVAALDGLRATLKTCATFSTHVYPGNLSRCPWCELKDRGVDLFPDLRVSGGKTSSAPFLYYGRACTSPHDLLALIGKDWDSATRFLAKDDNRNALDGWFRITRDQEHIANTLKSTDSDKSLTDVGRAFSYTQIIAKFSGCGPVEYKGITLSAEALSTLAESAVFGNRRAQSLLLEIHENGIVSIAGRIWPQTGLAKIARFWHEAAVDYDNKLQEVVRSGVRAPALKDDTKVKLLAAALPVSSVVNDLRSCAERAITTDARECSWFRNLGDPATATMGALIIMPHVVGAAEEIAKKRRYDSALRRYGLPARYALGITIGFLGTFVVVAPGLIVLLPIVWIWGEEVANAIVGIIALGCMLYGALSYRPDLERLVGNKSQNHNTVRTKGILWLCLTAAVLLGMLTQTSWLFWTAIAVQLVALYWFTMR